jgi:hypothetical protein
VRDLTVDYDAGFLREAVISRQRYRIVCRPPDAIPLAGTCSLDIGLPESAGTVAFENGGLTMIESPTGELNGVAGVSELASDRIAMAALLEQDLPRGTGSPTITIARERPLQLEGAESLESLTVATTDGTRIMTLSDVDTGTSAIRNDRPHPVNFVSGTWLPTEKLFVTAGLTFTTNGEALVHLHGDGTAVDTNGKHVAVVFYNGTRIDTLGYENVRDYEKTSPKARIARAKKLAQAAAATRAKDTHLVLALRRVRTSITMATGLITTARTAILSTAADSLGWERVIRSAHAAIEQADDAIIDAGRGTDEAVKRLGANDPCAGPLAVVGGDIHDLDDRLSTLMRALDAFTYSEDATRLEQIAKLVADGVAALPGSRITAHLATLQTFVNGAPQPMPAIVPEPSPTAKPKKTDATTPSPPP